MLDVVTLKNELQTQLQDPKEYFRLLSTFLSAKLAKREFDNYMKQHLQAGQIALHNAFILALLAQAFADTPPPEMLVNRVAKTKEKRRPKKPKHTSGSLPIKSHLRESSGIRNPKKMWLGRERGIVAMSTSGTTPEVRELRQRMMAIADEEGLEKVDDDSVTFMQTALHAHLLRLIKASPPVEASLNGNNKRGRDDPPIVSRASLRTAIETNGRALLCDDLPVQRERISMEF